MKYLVFLYFATTLGFASDYFPPQLDMTVWMSQAEEKTYYAFNELGDCMKYTESGLVEKYENYKYIRGAYYSSLKFGYQDLRKEFLYVKSINRLRLDGVDLKPIAFLPVHVYSKESFNVPSGFAFVVPPKGERYILHKRRGQLVFITGKFQGEFFTVSASGEDIHHSFIVVHSDLEMLESVDDPYKSIRRGEKKQSIRFAATNGLILLEDGEIIWNRLNQFYYVNHNSPIRKNTKAVYLDQNEPIITRFKEELILPNGKRFYRLLASDKYIHTPVDDDLVFFEAE